VTTVILLVALAPVLSALAALSGWWAARAWTIDGEQAGEAKEGRDLPPLAWLAPFLVAGAIGCGGAASFFRGPALWVGYPLALVLLHAAAFDARSRILPDWGAVAVVVGGVALAASRAGWQGVGDALMAGVFAGALLYLVERGVRAFTSRQALGMGDVKYAAAGGVLLGPIDIWTALGVAAFATLVFMFVSALIKRQPIERGPIAFGPALLGAIYIVFLAREVAPLLAN
jgi:leader peptidase (prepilin peptidase)/N-methyltransferase